MPSVSKQQQKFMGIVRAIQKGDAPASKFSKDARDAPVLIVPNSFKNTSVPSCKTFKVVT